MLKCVMIANLIAPLSALLCGFLCFIIILIQFLLIKNLDNL